MSTVTFSGGGASLDDQALTQVELDLGLRLPDTLRACYLKNNGGRPSPNIFVDAVGDDYEVHSFKSFGEPGFSGSSIEDSYRSLVARRLLPSHLLPFAMDSGGSFYCADASGAVWFCPMDGMNPEPIEIARSIDEFLDGLVSAQEAYG